MLIGQKLKNRYEIIRHLGSGGFGDTFLAKDWDLPGHPSCVVKHLKPKDSDPEVITLARKLFDQEAEILYRLGKHTQIPALFAHFETEEEFFLVQELVEGEDLSQEIIPDQKWSQTQTIAFLKDMLNVLAFVHSQNLIHRDIKPQNVMRRRQDQKLVLIDFGAVKQISTLTRTASTYTSLTVGIGSLGYMPSEQANGKPKPASDVYAVGMMAIQALTGMLPQQLEENHSTGEVIWQHLASPISPELATVLNKMVKDHFSQRYANATEALAAVNGVDSTTTNASKTIVSAPVANSSQSVATTIAQNPASSRSNRIPIYLAIAIFVGIIPVAVGMFIILNQPTPVANNPTETESQPKKDQKAIASSNPEEDKAGVTPQVTTPSNPDNSNQNEATPPTSNQPPATVKSPPVQPTYSPASLYSRLEGYLASQQWKLADQETSRLMLQLTQRGSKLDVSDINSVDCRYLYEINQLWNNYSQGYFGFSVQKQIWQQVGQNINSFRSAVGWRRNGKNLGSNSLSYSLNAPVGHLPSVQTLNHNFLLPRINVCGI